MPSESSTKKGNQIAQNKNEEEKSLILEVDESEDLNTLDYAEGRKNKVLYKSNRSSSLEGSSRFESFNSRANLYEITNITKKNFHPKKKFSAQNAVKYVNLNTQFDQSYIDNRTKIFDTVETNNDATPRIEKPEQQKLLSQTQRLNSCK